jgi:hypothetical protein
VRLAFRAPLNWYNAAVIGQRQYLCIGAWQNRHRHHIHRGTVDIVAHVQTRSTSSHRAVAIGIELVETGGSFTKVNRDTGKFPLLCHRNVFVHNGDIVPSAKG